MLDGEPAHEVELLLRVGGELVHADDGLQAEAVDDPDVPRQVRGAVLDLGEAALERAAVMLERLHAGDEHDCARTQVADAARDVEELLHPHVRGEARLGDHVLAELEGDAVGDERVVAVRDVREGAAVHERGLPFERLHEVRLDRVLQQHRERARRLELLRRDRLAIVRLADGDASEPLAQVGQVAGDGDEAHDLAGRGDVEPRLPRVAVGAPAEARDDVAQRAVVHVHAAPPRDRERVDAELVAVQDVRVDQRGEQVVRRRDGVQVTGEVEVQVLHRDDLRVAAAGGSALDAEHRPERRLAQREHGLAPELPETLRQRHRRRRLALTRRCRGDRGDVDQLGVGPVGEPLDDAPGRPSPSCGRRARARPARCRRRRRRR